MTRIYQLFSPLLFTFLFISSLLLSSCETTKSDPCDDTVRPEKAVTIQVTVHVLNLNDEPIEGEAISFEIFKTPCGAESKGNFKYTGVTNANGSWTCPTTGYNLRNSEDEVHCIGIATELENFFEQNFASGNYKYSDFSITQKEVHLYIYSTDQ